MQSIWGGENRKKLNNSTKIWANVLWNNSESNTTKNAEKKSIENQRVESQKKKLGRISEIDCFKNF